jgi:hypothetical protein
MSNKNSGEQLHTLIHNLNSTLSSLKQSVDIMVECLDSNRELVNKMAPLAKERGECALEIWEELKHEIKKREYLSEE